MRSIKSFAVVAMLAVFAAPVLAAPAAFAPIDVGAKISVVASPSIGPAIFAAQTDPFPLDWKAQLLQSFVTFVVGAAGVAATWALARLSAWANEKAKESKLAKALSVLPHMAEAVWADVYGELKDDIEAAGEDGKITPEELQALKEEALDALKASLAKNGLGALKDAFGPLLDGVLGKVIEKASQVAAAHTPPPP